MGHSCSNCWLLSFICLASLSIMYMSSVLFLLLVYLLIKLHKFCLYELISYFAESPHVSYVFWILVEVQNEAINILPRI